MLLLKFFGIGFGIPESKGIRAVGSVPDSDGPMMRERVIRYNVVT